MSAVQIDRLSEPRPTAFPAPAVLEHLRARGGLPHLMDWPGEDNRPAKRHRDRVAGALARVLIDHWHAHYPFPRRRR